MNVKPIRHTQGGRHTVRRSVLRASTDQRQMNVRQVNQCAHRIQRATVTVHERPLHQQHLSV